MNFCRRCGAALKLINNHIYTCESSHTIFANSSPAAGIFLLNPKNEVFLSVRGIEPHKGMLDALGGFVDGEETLENTIERELREEVGLEPSEYSKPQFLCSEIGHYPYKGETISLTTCLFWARLLTNRQLIPTDDVAELYIANIYEVDFDRMHDGDVKNGIKKLQSLLRQTNG